MMKFILIADHDDEISSFFPHWEVALFIASILCVLFFLYPTNLLDKVLAQDKPSAVTLSYLKAFRKIDTQNMQLLYALTEQEIGMGQLHQAKQNIALLKKPDHSQQLAPNQLLWLDYLLLRSRTYKSKPNTPKRITALRQLREMGEQLSDQSLNTSQLQSLAADQLALGRANLALKIYNRLLQDHALKTPEALAEGGSIAMQNNAHSDSAKFYWAAYLISSTFEEKKKYALDAIKVLWAGNLVQEAISLTQQLPPALLNDRATLLYLSQLALAANHPEIAEQYAIKALLLNTRKNHE